MASLKATAARRAREQRWSDLMVASQAGDQHAYAALLRDLQPALVGIVSRRWRRSDEAEDIVQDILISVHLSRHTYDPQRPFAPWLMVLVKRRIADAARRTRHSPQTETIDAEFLETFSADDTKLEQDRSDERSNVDAALARLPSQMQEAVRLTKLQGLSLAEAARRTGRTEGSLKVAVHRAMKLMRTFLGRDGKRDA